MACPKAPVVCLSVSVSLGHLADEDTHRSSESHLSRKLLRQAPTCAAHERPPGSHRDLRLGNGAWWQNGRGGGLLVCI